jgi:hypothetical protein
MEWELFSEFDLHICSGNMAKSKNHTNHNQNRKAHRNGIKRAKTGTKVSTKGVRLMTVFSS